MEKFTFYVAGPWKDKENVAVIAEKLRAAGWGVNSRWIDNEKEKDPSDPDYAEVRRTNALRDVEDVIMADGLIYVNTMKSEGKATELGMAIATMKPIVIVGDRGRDGNIFLALNIPYHRTIEEAIEWLSSPEGEDYIEWVLDRRINFILSAAHLEDLLEEAALPEVKYVNE